jgi:hypothetical protein
VDLQTLTGLPGSLVSSSASGVWTNGTTTYVVGWGTTAPPNSHSEALLWTKVTCYPNCDGSTAAPALNVADFSCFLNRFFAADTYANCDHSTTAPVLGISDFICFTNAFAAGCP